MSGSSTAKALRRWFQGRDAYVPHKNRGQQIRPDDAFCSEIVALLLDERQRKSRADR